MKFQRRFFLLAIFALAIVFYLVIYSSSDFPFSNQSDSKATSQNSISKVPSILFDEKLWKKFVNNNGTVWNQDKFLSKFINSSMVIVVQVHQRIENLRALIDSMRKVRFIDESLIVFSHDYYDDSINNVIRTIDFTQVCFYSIFIIISNKFSFQVTQIFFPFSTQVWINTFPGTSYNDCKRDMTRKKAIEVDCINSKYPDTYGHYRESAITQTKHHWWWKANYVLDQLPITKNHPGIFVFIEEDHYILPDFIHSWKLMQDVKRSLNKQNERVDIFTFGNYDKISKVATNSNGIMYTEWFSSKHNMAFSIDRDLWTKLKLCSAVFCTYDDYNWDWTMQHIMQNCFDDPPFTLVPIIPR